MNTSYIKIGRILSILLILAFIATSIFIFSNSLKSRSSSANDSDSVTSVIKPFVDPDGKVTSIAFTKIIRKLAHFAEFALLGVELALFRLVFKKRSALFEKIFSYPCLMLIALIMALLDETLQIFSGRSAEVTDVWIDFSGSIFGILFVYLAVALIGYFKKRSKSNSPAQEL